jgi:hypothetical protein
MRARVIAIILSASVSARFFTPSQLGHRGHQVFLTVLCPGATEKRSLDLYRCICCGNALFSSDTKFESGTGWPSFWAPIAKENIRNANDDSLGMSRTSVSCTECEDTQFQNRSSGASNSYDSYHSAVDLRPFGSTKTHLCRARKRANVLTNDSL